MLAGRPTRISLGHQRQHGVIHKVFPRRINYPFQGKMRRNPLLGENGGISVKTDFSASVRLPIDFNFNSIIRLSAPSFPQRN
jgi:hypothetical protein